MTQAPIAGAGLGFRRSFLNDWDAFLAARPDYVEVAPENWMEVGGRLGRAFGRLREAVPIVCHGLSLNIGGPAPLDVEFLGRVRAFLERHRIDLYTEHLSYTGDDGHLYDLLPLPFTETAVRWVAGRIRQVQDLLGRRIAMENVSYYCTPAAEMSELEFVNAVLAEADCLLHLDVNNIYVNSVNHGYDARAFLAGLPGERICHAHVAGHAREGEDLIVDTHGAPVVDPVFDLLAEAYRLFGVFPTVVERDFNIPPIGELMVEVQRVADLQAGARAATRQGDGRIQRVA